MERKKSKEWGDGARTYQAGEPIDCSGWSQCRVAESRYNGFKIEYRLAKIDKGSPIVINSSTDTEPVNQSFTNTGDTPMTPAR